MQGQEKNRKFKLILVIVLAVLLVFPLLQQNLLGIKMKSLKGYYVLAPKPRFTWDGWWDVTYQDGLEKYVRDHIGFRSLFVRIYNQMSYSFFDELRAKSVVRGKEMYLYEMSYIKAYYGWDFIGEEVIQEKVRKLKKVQDTLAQKGIDVIVILAPGKGTFYPEYFPEEYAHDTVGKTNYSVYAAEMQKQGINFMDFNQWFLNMKDTASYPLYPKTGIHWSEYGQFLAMDSAAKYVSKLHGIKMPGYNLKEVETSHKMRGRDEDVERALNLLFDVADLKMAYPAFQIERNHVTQETRCLVISDSYYWGIYNWKAEKNVIGTGDFWYYNQQAFNYEGKMYDVKYEVKNKNILGEIEKHDVIILMSTDANLHKFAFGFIEDVHDAYLGN